MSTKKKKPSAKTVTEKLHTLTLRAVGPNAALIQNVIVLTKQKTATGAIFCALREYEYNLRRIEELEKENAHIQQRLYEVNIGLTHFKDFLEFLRDPEPKRKTYKKHDELIGGRFVQDF